MVFLTAVNFARSLVCSLPRFRPVIPDGRGPDKFWRKQQFLRFSFHFHGRKRRCWKLGIRNVHKSLLYSTKGRTLKKDYTKMLWETRLDAASQEHGLGNGTLLREGLQRCQIQLDRKVLSDLAIYEPRSFQSLTEVAKKRLAEEGIDYTNKDKKGFSDFENVHERPFRLPESERYNV